MKRCTLEISIIPEGEIVSAPLIDISDAPSVRRVFYTISDGTYIKTFEERENTLVVVDNDECKNLREPVRTMDITEEQFKSFDKYNINNVDYVAGILGVDIIRSILHFLG